MIDISVKNVNKFFGASQILNNLSFEVFEGEKVALLGKNGAGKTTVLNILAGTLPFEAGEVAIPPGKKTGMLSQIPSYPAGYTVEDVLRSAFDELLRLKDELKRLERLMEHDHSKSTLDRYGALSARFEARDGYNIEVLISKTAAGLSIGTEMRAQEFNTLSGGEMTRVNLARMILEETDILLLDEPTNHLDMPAVQWLEEFLLKYKGTALIISHDRYFLDRVVKRVIELRDGVGEFYEGNYSFYVREKEARYIESLKKYEKEQQKIKQLEEAACKLHIWAQGHDNPKLHKRARDMERRIERIGKTDRPRQERAMGARFNEREFRGDDMLCVKGVTKGFSGKSLFHGVDLEVTADEQIALIGENGAGKSTLVKIILGEEPADSGQVKLGPAVKTAYLPQSVHFARPERTLLDTLVYELDCTPQAARNMLAAFKFKGDDVFKTVMSLSGGEQSRLKLCMLMSGDINLLILDEPTNHLDIASREWIEEALLEYGGTLIFVSHDRYFINKFAGRIWELRDGEILDFRGDYEDYKLYNERQKQAAVIEKATRKPKAKKKNTEDRVSELERLIKSAEAALDSLELEMEAAATEFDLLGALYDKKRALDIERDALYEELWKVDSERPIC